MLATIGTVENFMTMPSPILDDSEQGYHLEERLQVTLKSAVDERQLMIEFRLGDTSATPSEQVLAKWLEEDELVAALCTGISARPSVQKQDKSSRREAQVGEQTAHPDGMVVLAGQTMVALSEGIDLREAVKSTRAAYKRAQRDNTLRRNAERVEQFKAQLPERVRRLKERQIPQAQEDDSTSYETSPSGLQRNAELFKAQLPEFNRQLKERQTAQAQEDGFTPPDTGPNARIR